MFPNLPGLRLSSLDPAAMDDRLIDRITHRPAGDAARPPVACRRGSDMILKRMKPPSFAPRTGAGAGRAAQGEAPRHRDWCRPDRRVSDRGRADVRRHAGADRRLRRSSTRTSSRIRRGQGTPAARMPQVAPARSAATRAAQLRDPLRPSEPPTLAGNGLIGSHAIGVGRTSRHPRPCRQLRRSVSSTRSRRIRAASPAVRITGDHRHSVSSGTAGMSTNPPHGTTSCSVAFKSHVRSADRQPRRPWRVRASTTRRSTTSRRR